MSSKFCQNDVPRSASKTEPVDVVIVGVLGIGEVVVSVFSLQQRRELHQKQARTTQTSHHPVNDRRRGPGRPVNSHMTAKRKRGNDDCRIDSPHQGDAPRPIWQLPRRVDPALDPTTSGLQHPRKQHHRQQRHRYSCPIDNDRSDAVCERT